MSVTTENGPLLILMCGYFRRASDTNYCFSLTSGQVSPKESTTCSADQQLQLALCVSSCSRIMCSCQFHAFGCESRLCTCSCGCDAHVLFRASGSSVKQIDLNKTPKLVHQTLLARIVLLLVLFGGWYRTDQSRGMDRSRF